MSGHELLFIGPIDRVLQLRTLPWLAGVPTTVLAALARSAQEKVLTQGEWLIQEDEPVDAFYLVVDGRVEVDGYGEVGGEAAPGDAIGLLHMLARTEGGFRARAVEETLTLRFDWESQLDVAELEFAIVAEYVRHIARLSLDLRLRNPGPPPGGTPVTDDTMVGEAGIVHRTLALRASPTFRSDALDALYELARQAREVRWSDGAVLWRPGESGSEMLEIVSGAVECRLGERAWVIGSAGPAIGIPESLSGHQRWYEARATGEVTALLIDREALFDIMEDHFELAVDFVTRLASGHLVLVEESTGRPPHHR